MKFLPGQQVVVRGYRYPAKVLNYDRKDRYPFYNLETVGGSIFSTYEDQMELYTPDPELSKLAGQLLNECLFDVADAMEAYYDLELFDVKPTQQTPQQAEDQEVRDIMRCLDRPNFPTRFEALIHVLVSNGTLTLKQVERALGADNV